MQDKPLIVQSDKTLLLDVHSPAAEECRNALIPFAELEKSPEHLHTYRLTPLSLWNAASCGFSTEDAIEVLKKFSRYEVPQVVCAWIEQVGLRFGKLIILPDFTEKTEAENELETQGESLFLVTENANIYAEIKATRALEKYLIPYPIDTEEYYKFKNTNSNLPVYGFKLSLMDRGTIKQELLKLGWPVKDEVPLREGEPLNINLRKETSNGKPLTIREYQEEAAKALVGDKGPGTGFYYIQNKSKIIIKIL